MGAAILLEFRYHIANARPGFFGAGALQPDADLRAVVPAEHRAVLYQGHLKSQARCRHRRAKAGYTAAHDDEIKALGIHRLPGKSEQLVTKLRRGRPRIGWA